MISGAKARALRLKSPRIGQGRNAFMEGSWLTAPDYQIVVPVSPAFSTSRQTSVSYCTNLFWHGYFWKQHLPRLLQGGSSWPGTRDSSEGSERFKKTRSEACKRRNFFSIMDWKGPRRRDRHVTTPSSVSGTIAQVGKIAVLFPCFNALGKQIHFSIAVGRSSTFHHTILISRSCGYYIRERHPSD